MLLGVLLAAGWCVVTHPMEVHQRTEPLTEGRQVSLGFAGATGDDECFELVQHHSARPQQMVVAACVALGAGKGLLEPERDSLPVSALLLESCCLTSSRRHNSLQVQHGPIPGNLSLYF